MEWIRTLAGQAGERFLPVLDMMNQAAADPEKKDYVSVMSLTCGSGKSSAITLKIAQVIHDIRENGSMDGLLIVSDTKEALKRYLDPKLMPQVKAYLEANKSLISRMDEDTYDAEKSRYWRCPVLLITYARYFGRTKKQIQRSFLRWRKDNPRSLVIMDEQPPIVKCTQIGNDQIAQFDAQLRNGLNIADPEKYQWCVEQWEAIRNRLYGIIEGRSLRELQSSRNVFFLEKPKDEEIQENVLKEFADTVEESQEAIQAEESDILKTFNAMLSIIREGAFGYGYQKSDGRRNVVLMPVKNNTDLLKDLGAKIVILDGTADISPLYNMSCFYRLPCEEINTRRLDNLTIKLVHINTSKWAFTIRKEEIVSCVKDYLRTQTDDLASVGLITYIKQPEKAFNSEREYGLIEHFGNTRGRNDMQEYHQMVQVGLHRKPPLVYTLEHLEINQDSMGESSVKEGLFESPDEFVSRFLRDLSEEGKDPDDLMNLEILADLEQNVFRTALRNPEDTGKVTFYLFADLKGWSRLINLIYERFSGKYGAKIEQEDYAAVAIRKIRRRNTNANRLINWLAQRQVGEEFSKNGMLAETGLTENQFHSIKKDRPIIASWFREMAESVTPPKKGVYKMTAEILRYLA